MLRPAHCGWRATLRVRGPSPRAVTRYSVAPSRPAYGSRASPICQPRRPLPRVLVQRENVLERGGGHLRAERRLWLKKEDVQI